MANSTFAGFECVYQGWCTGSVHQYHLQRPMEDVELSQHPATKRCNGRRIGVFPRQPTLYFGKVRERKGLHDGSQGLRNWYRIVWDMAKKTGTYSAGVPWGTRGPG